MRKNRLIALGIVVTVVLGAGFTAWAKKDAKYVGSEKCMACHKRSHASIVGGYVKTAHASAMIDAATKPEAILAKFDANSPVKKEDVKYVLGIGRSYQNYLDKDLKVLPGKWDTKSQSWAAFASADGATQCVGCHVTNFDPDAKSWTQLGVGCESCHGPGAAHMDSMDAADIQTLKKLDSKKKAMVCGQCHSVGADTTGKYAFPVNYLPGGDLDKSFKLTDPGDRLQNRQYNDFVTSKHYEGGMTCANCHDPHGDKAKGPYQLKQPINDLCLACHSSTIESLKKHAPSAGPEDTCATCHMVNGSHKFQKPGK
jgi:predicted CXXCH cytochrome family protein